MKLYAVAIDYPETSVTVGCFRARMSAVRLAIRLKQDPCYAAPDATWQIETRDVSFWEWLRGKA